MKIEIDGVARRTRRYWYEDGFAELASGGLMLLAGFGLAAAYQAFLGWSAGSPDLGTRCLVAVLVVGVAQVLAVVGGRAMRGGIEAAKERVTYPRTGYVAYRQPRAKQRSLPEKIGLLALVSLLSLVGGAVMGNVLGTLASSGTVPIWLLSMPMSLGAIIALVLGLLGRQMALPRFYGLAVISLLAGMVSALSSIDFEGAMLYLVLMGALLLASGGVTLWRYARRNALPASAEAGDHGR